LLCQNLPRWCPLKAIPRGGIRELKRWLAIRIDLDGGSPRAARGIKLEVRSAKAKMLEAVFGFIAEFILANSASNNAFITEQTSHVGKISRRAPKLLARWENVPEEFSQPDDRISLFAHSLTGCPRVFYQKISLDILVTLPYITCWDISQRQRLGRFFFYIDNSSFPSQTKSGQNRSRNLCMQVF
jgi:hypothetical protein